MINRRRLIVTGAVAAASGWGRVTAAETPGPAPSAGPADATILLEAGPRAAPEAPASGPPLGYGQKGAPILRVGRGTTSTVRLVNHLAEATGLDWHGMRLPNALDLDASLGGRPIAAGETRDIALPAPESGTFWFHPPFGPGMSDQTARGLSGVLIVQEPDAPEVDADTVLLLTDRSEAGAALVDRLAINGRAWPDTRTHKPGARIRLRLVNGSTREAVAATFAGAQPFVIAIDGQPSELFRPLNDTVPVGPGARFDLMVDLPRDAGAEFKLALQGSNGSATQPNPPVYVARTEGSAGPERPPIRSLTPNPALPRAIPLEHSVRAEAVAAMRPAATAAGPAAWTFNGSDGRVLGKKPLFTAKRGSPVTLGLVNRSTSLTAFRLHGHVVRLLHSKDDGWEPYWRDSVIVPAGGTYHVALLAANPGRWVIESPFFDQSSRGLRAWFEVT